MVNHIHDHECVTKALVTISKLVSILFHFPPTAKIILGPEPQFIVSTEGLKKSVIAPVTLGLQGEWIMDCTMETFFRFVSNLPELTC